MAKRKNDSWNGVEELKQHLHCMQNISNKAKPQCKFAIFWQTDISKTAKTGRSAKHFGLRHYTLSLLFPY